MLLADLPELGQLNRKQIAALVDVDLERVKRLAYRSRDYVVEKSGFTMPSI